MMTPVLIAVAGAAEAAYFSSDVDYLQPARVRIDPAEVLRPRRQHASAGPGGGDRIAVPERALVYYL